jgi:hypothetical protein
MAHEKRSKGFGWLGLKGSREVRHLLPAAAVLVLLAFGAAGPASSPLMQQDPLVSLVARVPARFWPSSEVQVEPPGRVHYADYTHFNLVVADSRLFRLTSDGARVEFSSPEVRRSLGTGLGQ